jgi:hypothetical protein
MRLNIVLAVDWEEAVERKSAACSSSSRSRSRPALYLASPRKDDGTVVTFDRAGQITSVKEFARPGRRNAAGDRTLGAANAGVPSVCP